MVPLRHRLGYAWRVVTGRAYEAAQASPQHLSRPLASNLSPDGALETAQASLREWGRYLDENYDLAIGVIDDLVTNIVGTGIVVEPLPTLGGRFNPDLASRILDVWHEWARSPEVTRELPWSELQRLSCRGWLNAGEFFAQHVRASAPYDFRGGVRYRVEYLESEMVPGDEITRENQQYRYGVYLDDWNSPIAYDVYRRHPNDPQDLLKGRGTFASTADLKQVRAEDMMHCKFVRRWPQTRGVPIIHGIIRRLADIKDYEESERVAARVAASMCAFIRKSPDTYVAPVTGNVSGEREIKFQAGKVFDDLLAGEEVSTIDVDRPNSELTAFRNAMLRAVAAGTGTRYSSIAKDYSGTYSSQRQELVEARPHYLRLRNYYVAKFVQPVYENVLRQAWLEGRLGIPDSVPFADISAAEYIGPGQPWIDPLKEVQSYVLAIDNGLITREQVIRTLGGDPRTIDAPDENAPNLTVVESDDDEDESDTEDTGT